MRIRLRFAAFAFTVLILLAVGIERVHAGSFFGPSCYGSTYAYQYPNRARYVFGCGPGYHCTAWHPFFGHWFHKNKGVPMDGTFAPPLAPVAAPVVAEPAGKPAF